MQLIERVYAQLKFLKNALVSWSMEKTHKMKWMMNKWQGVALVAARSTRLPIYRCFAGEQNLGDLHAKGEALSVFFNLWGLAAGMKLASSICLSAQGKVSCGSSVIVRCRCFVAWIGWQTHFPWLPVDCLSSSHGCSLVLREEANEGSSN